MQQSTNYTYGRAPPDYNTPPFPSLYWPIKAEPSTIAHLYHTTDVWRFTLYWTLILFAAFHITSGIYAFFMMPSRLSLAIPLVFAIVGGIEAVLSGSIVGLIIAMVYRAGYLRMSTWIPLTWSLINVMVLVLSSFSLQGGL